MPIDREQNSIIKRCVSENGARSITHYEVMNSSSKILKKNGPNNQSPIKTISNLSTTDYNFKISENFEIVKCLLETGRTHQIRVHFAAIGHPLLGDTLYGFSSYRYFLRTARDDWTRSFLYLREMISTLWH